MIAFAYGLLVVICSWFGFNSIAVLHTHLFEFTFEFAYIPIVKDNKLRSWVTCQPGVMKQNLVDLTDLFVALIISNQPVAGCIIVSASRECVLAGVLIVNGSTRSTHTITQGYSVRFCCFRQEKLVLLMVLLYHFTKLLIET
jgi:hypothetical protein